MRKPLWVAGLLPDTAEGGAKKKGMQGERDSGDGSQRKVDHRRVVMILMIMILVIMMAIL